GGGDDGWKSSTSCRRIGMSRSSVPKGATASGCQSNNALAPAFASAAASPCAGTGAGGPAFGGDELQAASKSSSAEDLRAADPAVAAVLPRRARASRLESPAGRPAALGMFRQEPDDVRVARVPA